MYLTQSNVNSVHTHEHEYCRYLSWRPIVILPNWPTWPKAQEERTCLLHCCLISCAHAQFCFEHVPHLLRAVLCGGSSHVWQLCAVCKDSSRASFTPSLCLRHQKRAEFLPTLRQSWSNQHQWTGWCSLTCRSIYQWHVPGSVFPQGECLCYKSEQCKGRTHSAVTTQNRILVCVSDLSFLFN